MTIKANRSNPMFLDNLLKAVLALFVGLVGYMGREQAAKVERVEAQLGEIKIELSEIRTHLKYISGLKTGDHGQGKDDHTPGVSAGPGWPVPPAVAAREPD